MIKWLTIIFLGFPAVLQPIFINAQMGFEKAVLLTTENGLPTNDVRSMSKGSDGFLWIATSDGLCRYDGQQVKIYRQQDKSSIRENGVTAVLPLENEIWVGTGSGLCILDIKSDSFRNMDLPVDEIRQSRSIPQSIQVLKLSGNNLILVGTRAHGAWAFNRTTKKFRPIQLMNDSSSIKPLLGTPSGILSIEPDPVNSNIAWLGTPGGLLKANLSDFSSERYVFPKKNFDHQVAVNAFRRLYKHYNGLLYAGSWSAGVNVFDPVRKNLVPLVLKNDKAKKLLLGAVSSIYGHNKDEFWITTGSGLILYNIKLQDAVLVKENVQLDEKFYGVDLIDDRGRAWNANINGIQCFDPVMQQFSEFFYDHLYGKNWAFTFYIHHDKINDRLIVCPRPTDAFYIFNRKNQSWSKLPLGKTINSRGFIEMAKNEFIISTLDGLYSFSLQEKKLKLIKNAPRLNFNQWHGMEKDRNGKVWVSSDEEGVVEWDPRTGSFKKYEHELVEGSTDAIGRISRIFVDSENNVWMNRPYGFSVFQRKTKKILNFHTGKDPSKTFAGIQGFAEDRNKKVWMFTTGWLGYAKMDSLENGIVYKTRLEDKGLDNTIQQIATDANGDVWGQTDLHLFRINTDDRSILSYNFQYGLKRADFYHFSVLSTGEMVFGGRTKIVIVNPSTLRHNPEPPVPYISQVSILNNIFSQGFPSSGKITLKHWQNQFAIAFSAKAYTLGNRSNFHYRLKGYEDWQKVRGANLASYSNLPGGKYVFQLRAANNENIWNPMVIELPVEILIPWWKTAWFRLISLLGILAILYSIYWLRISQVRKKEKLKAEYEKKLANVEMTALLAQMNPHFLFNSLNSIDSYIIRNESKKASEYLNNFAKLMRLILQNSKSNYVSLKDELEALDLYLQMEALRFQQKFNYEIQLDHNITPDNILIPPMLIQPYVENAIWHGLMHQEKGKPGWVRILISLKENRIHCIVEDNGIGRAKAMELRMQRQGPKRKSMGMEITRERMEMINKLYSTHTSVKVHDLKDASDNALGTRVELIIPV